MPHFNSAPEFKKAAEDWLRPLGFMASLTNTSGTYISYSAVDHAASIAVTYNATTGEASAECFGIAAWQFLRVSTGKLEFGHSRIMQYVEAVDDLVQQSETSKIRIARAAQLKAYHEGDKQ